MAKTIEKKAYKGTIKGINTAKSLISGGKAIGSGLVTLLNIGLNPFMKTKVGVSGVTAGIKYLMKNDKLQKQINKRASETLQSKSFAKNYVDPGKNINVTQAMKNIKADKVKVTRDRVVAAKKVRTGLKELGTTGLAYSSLLGAEVYNYNKNKLNKNQSKVRKNQMKGVQSSPVNY